MSQNDENGNAVPDDNVTDTDDTQIALDELLSQKQKETDALKGMFNVLGKIESRHRESKEKPEK